MAQRPEPLPFEQLRRNPFELRQGVKVCAETLSSYEEVMLLLQMHPIFGLGTRDFRKAKRHLGG